MIPSYQFTCGGSDITSILSFNCSSGRQSKTDVYASGTASFTVRNPQDLPASVVMEALVSCGANGRSLFSGYVTNIQFNYGMVTNEDTCTISLEGYLSFLGRGYLDNFALTGGTTGAEANRIGTSLSGSAKTISNIGTSSLTDTSSYTGAAQNILTTLVSQEQGRLQEGSGQLYFFGRSYLQNPAASPYFFFDFKFTDTNPGTTGVAYNAVNFASSTDNYFTQTTITPASVAPQFAGNGSRNLQLSTYDPTTTQADNLAKYALNEFNSNTSVPQSISTKNSLDSAMDPIEMLLVGWQLPIIFRGTTYQTIIEGWTISANPEDIFYTFYVSGFEQNNYLKLDDAVFGRLDYNKLGF